MAAHPFSVVVFAACAAASVAAQGVNESRGPLAGAATAVLVDGGLAGSTDAETRVHRNGFTLAPTRDAAVARNCSPTCARS